MFFVFKTNIFRSFKNELILNTTPTILAEATLADRHIIIFCGLSEIFRAIAAGMINIPVINNNPTILIDIAIMAAINIVKIAFALSGFKHSASANS